MIYRSFFTLCVFLAASGLQVHAQGIEGVATRWSDSFRQWILFDASGENGTLELRWLNGSDWTEYQINWDGVYGQVRLVRPDEWTLQLGTDLITIRAVFPRDPSEWRIIGSEVQLTFKARYPNQREDWFLREGTYGQFTIYTTYQGDLREWTVEDQITDDRVEDGMKAAMVFITLAQSTPKR